jgi:putative transcriptional regulator
MMQRQKLIADVHSTLRKAGFATSDPKDLAHSGFDIVARRDSTILVVKVILNANSLDEAMLASMKSLAGALDGSSLIVAVKSGEDAIEDGVSYSRAGIPLISHSTLEDLLLEGVPPLVYAASGGYYVNMDSELLRKAREQGHSLGDLAEMGGVSRRTIKMYEDGMNAKVEVALRLEEALGIELILPGDPLNCPKSRESAAPREDFEGMARDIFSRLNKIGYSIMPMSRCPFDAVTKDSDVVIFTGIDRRRPGLEKRARAMANLSRILGKHPVIFMDRMGEKVNLEGTPLITCGELRKARDRKKVIELIEERY